MPTDPMTVLFYVVTLAILAVFHFVIVPNRRWLGRRFAPAPEGPRCSHCGHINYRGMSEVCSECGHGLEEAKRLDRNPPPARPVVPIMAAAVLLFPLSVALAYPIAALFPQVWQADARFYVAGAPHSAEISAYVKGRASARRVRWAHLTLGEPRSRTLAVDLDRMELKPLGRSNRGAAPVAISQQGLQDLLGGGNDEATALLAREIVKELTGLRDNRWPEDRFKHEISGSYVIDPDDELGSFFWLPSYTLACVPVWLGMTFAAARVLIRRYRASVQRWCAAGYGDPKMRGE